MIRAPQHRLARHTSVSRRHIVCSYKAGSAASAQRIRIRISIGLARRIGRPGSIDLAEDIGDRRRGDVVVVGRASEDPGVATIGPSVGVHRVADVNSADGRSRLTAYTSDRRDGRRMRLAIIRHVVRGHHNRRVSLADS